MQHLVYKITNNVNSRYYIGVHSTNNLDDGYMGSGMLIRRAIAKYGIDNFTKTILFTTDNIDAAYAEEKRIVRSVYDDPLSYNINEGGKGGWGMVNKNPDRIYAMDRPGARERLSTTLKTKYASDPAYRDSRLKNLELATSAAVIANTGKTRPDHSDKLKELYKMPDNAMVLSIKTSGTYKLISPSGEEIITDDLLKYCKENKLGYGALLTSCRDSNRVIRRGRSKGWTCFILEKSQYTNVLYNEYDKSRD